MKIEQNTPSKIHFSLHEFFIKQINFKVSDTTETVGFYPFCTRDWMDINLSHIPAAVFKIKPKRFLTVVNEAGELEAYEMQGI